MLALYIASKGGATFQTMQDTLPRDEWTKDALHQGSVAVAWRAVKALADSIFTPPWRLFLRQAFHMSISFLNNHAIAKKTPLSHPS